MSLQPGPVVAAGYAQLGQCRRRGALALTRREASAKECKANGKACKKTGQCCSGNCVGGSGGGSIGRSEGVCRATCANGSDFCHTPYGCNGNQSYSCASTGGGTGFVARSDNA